MLNAEHKSPFTDNLLVKLGLAPVPGMISGQVIKHFAKKNPEAFTKTTGITTRVPPDDIHRMQKRDPLWVGDFYSANLVVDSLNNSNIQTEAEVVLDLGCSSGSLVRVLKAFSLWEIYGCDPIASAIDWAKSNISDVNFRVIETKPPLPYPDEAFSGMTAISIWSHHAPDAAEEWLLEARRVLKSGGWCILTFCGFTHCKWLERTKRRSPQVISDIRRALNKEGYWFRHIDYSEEESQTGSNWGHAVYDDTVFLDMVKRAGLTPVTHWRGRNQGNQDVLVLLKN